MGCITPKCHKNMSGSIINNFGTAYNISQYCNFIIIMQFMHIFSTVIPYIIRDSFIKVVKFPAPESFTLSVEFIAICISYTVSWKFNGQQTTNDSDHLITSNSVSSSRHMTSLTIMESSGSKSGVYSVIVSTVHGRDSVNISVEIISEYNLLLYVTT